MALFRGCFAAVLMAPPVRWPARSSSLLFSGPTPQPGCQAWLAVDQPRWLRQKAQPRSLHCFGGLVELGGRSIPMSKHSSSHPTRFPAPIRAGQGGRRLVRAALVGVAVLTVGPLAGISPLAGRGQLSRWGQPAAAATASLLTVNDPSSTLLGELNTVEVNGSGVVGQQPVLRPGGRFEYTSGCPLTTPSGMMQGAYRFEDVSGGMVDARIPLFALDSPYDDRRPN